MPRHGTADLPLHSGSAPRWLFDRMVDLGGAIAEVIVRDYGQAELCRRLADPYWFQALGCVLGFDWHSSGVTTTTVGALKEALDPQEHGVLVAGGKGATSRRTPDEIAEADLRLSGSRREELARTSRLAAAVDNGCVQDEHTLYHHAMVVTESGEWTVVQQGMADSTARRYHWTSRAVEDYVEEPQSAICAMAGAETLDLTAAGSAETRDVSVDLVQDDPDYLRRFVRPAGQSSLAAFGAGGGAAGGLEGTTTTDAPVELDMPAHHELRQADLTERSVGQLQRAYEAQPDDYEELVAADGVGPGSLRALALVAEVVHDAPATREDPAKYAYAHGGKDGTPHPVERERYDDSIAFLRELLEGAEAERETKQSALDRLAELAE